MELVGRQRELAALRDAIGTAAGGDGGILLVAGEGGVGKTALVESALAEDGGLVLRGAADQRVVRPYAPVVAALRGYQRAVPDGLAGSGPLSEHLALILPELGSPPADTDQATLFEAVGNLFEQIARRQSTVVFLDDLQWLDGATAELLLQLDRALEAAPVLVLGAYRSDEVPRGHQLRRVRSELRRRRRLQELTVEPLGPVDTAELAARVLGARPGNRLARALYDRTQGVPFFIEELAVALATAGRLATAAGTVELGPEETLPLPDTIRETVLLRTERLSSAGRHTLEMAAAAGLRFDLELLAALGGADGIDEAIQRGFLVEVDQQGRFRHALIREAVYDDTPWTRRRTYHRRLAEELARRGAAPEAVAEQWLAAGERDRARPSLLAAAERFCQVHAYHDATRAISRAIELWPEGQDEDDRLAALERLGHCAQLHGDLAGATRAWQEVVEACRARGDLIRLAELQRRLAGMYELQGAWDRALAARAAAEAFAEQGQELEAATEQLAAATHLQAAANLTSALDLIASAGPGVERTGSIQLRVHTLSLEGQIRAKLGDTQRGVELARQGLALALAENLTEPAAEAYYRLASALQAATDYPQALDAYAAASDFCDQQGIAGMGEVCFACLAPVMVKTGEWDRAVEVCRAILDVGDAPATARMVAAAELGIVYVLRGETRRTRRLLSDSLAFARRNQRFGLEVEAAHGLARADALEGRVDDALQRARDLIGRIADREERHYSVSALRWTTTMFARQGLTADVARSAELLSQTAAALGTAEAVAGLGHALGELALVDGDAAGAAQQFTRALDLLGDVSVPYERAETELRAAIALAAAGERGLAIERLTSVYRTARRLGARPLAREAAEELARLGEKVERRLGRRAAGELEHAGLSRRELEVLRLVSVGRTNREIARELFLSPRTIDMHVRNVLTKLGCRSRTEATRRAAELGLLESQL
jgi:predicted ATPase/DNA-binding NarL/FixJ family response regulator